MSEFEQTPKTPTSYEEDIDQALELAQLGRHAPEPESINLFEDENWLAAGQAARRTVEASPQVENTPSYSEPKPLNEPVQTPSRPSVGMKIAATTGALLATGAVIGGISNEYKTPEFSEETTVYTVQEGEGISAAAQHVKGDRDIRDAVDYIAADPANIDVLKDGLQPGEQLVIPVSVEGYEADKE